MEIAPKFTVALWKRLWERTDISDDTRWMRAVVVWRSRIISRFIRPADFLLSGHSNRMKPGFIVISIDFIIIETIQGFIDGKAEHTELDSKGNKKTISSRMVSKYLLENNEFCSITEKINIKHLYDFARCGITHTGRTKGDFRLYDESKWSNELICKYRLIDNSEILLKYKDTYYLNRDRFHSAVKISFDNYCKKLLTSDNSNLRSNFITIMNTICGISE